MYVFLNNEKYLMITFHKLQINQIKNIRGLDPEIITMSPPNEKRGYLNFMKIKYNLGRIDYISFLDID